MSSHAAPAAPRGAAGYPKDGSARKRTTLTGAHGPERQVGWDGGGLFHAGRLAGAGPRPSLPETVLPTLASGGGAGQPSSLSLAAVVLAFGSLAGSEAFGWLDSAARARRHACTSVPEVKGEKQSIAMVMADDAM